MILFTKTDLYQIVKTTNQKRDLYIIVYTILLPNQERKLHSHF